MGPPPSPPSELMEELVEEVLLRFPPDDPASLVRAALVCRLWRRLVSAAAFRRRFLEFHRRPTLLGILCDGQNEPFPDEDEYGMLPTACFVPTSSFRPARAAGHYGQRAIDARHGRVLLHHVPSESGSLRTPCRVDLSVWDPITDEQRVLPSLPVHMFRNPRSWNAAVLCAATASGGTGCDHLDCHRKPFMVVFMGIKNSRMFACIYASDKASAWSEVAITDLHCNYFEPAPGVLVGNTLHFLAYSGYAIANYDMATCAISVLHLPWEFRYPNIMLVTTEDGRLGLANMDGKYKLCLWSMEVDNNKDATFVPTSRVINLEKLVDNNKDATLVPSRVIDLEKLLPVNALKVSLYLSGFAEGARLIFVWTFDGLYSIDMMSKQVKKVSGCYALDVVPYLSFHTSELEATSTCDGPPTDQERASFPIA
ncbi:unnamed protein product [Urochloa decumbens]|uniref:F-box domain-containing protein n=1 Tax=Urochloa decumbens TaxID=240449 RepID=A0ABC9FLE7_9POAL